MDAVFVSRAFATGDLLCKSLLYGESVRIVEDCLPRRLLDFDGACGNAHSSDTDTRLTDVEDRESALSATAADSTDVDGTGAPEVGIIVGDSTATGGI